MQKNRFRLLLLSALLALTLLFAVGCDKDTAAGAASGTEADTTASDPAATDGETTTATTDDTRPAESMTADTDTETKPADTAADKAEAAAFLDKLIAMDIESNSTNYRGTVDLTFDIKAGVGGMTNTQTMPIQMDSIVDGDKFQAIMNMMGVECNVIYVDGIVYVDAMDEKVFMTASPEQAGDITDMLFGSDDGSDDATGGMDFEIPEGIGTADLFQNITLEKLTDGTARVTVKGLAAEQAETLAPTFMPFLLSMNLIGYDMVEYDEEQLLKDTVAILKTLGADKFSFSMTTDANGALNGIYLDITFNSSFKSEGQTIETTVGIKGGITYKEGGQSVKVPADISEYVETNWEDYFGEGDLGDPETLGLLPGEDGKITLSNELARRSEQLSYICCYPEEFEGMTFCIEGLLGFYAYDDGTESGMLFLNDENGDMDYMTYIEVILDPDHEDALREKITDDGEEPTVMYRTEGEFVVVAVEDVEYVVYVLTAIN